MENYLLGYNNPIGLKGEKNMLFKNASELVGKTPILKLDNFTKLLDIQENEIYVKLEMFNLKGSVKDRIALKMYDEAIKTNKINKDTIIIEPTSGNTGIGIAAIAAIRGNKCILVMPETMSVERRKMMTSYGAEIILTEGALGTKGAIDKALELNSQIENSFILSQFDNPANPLVHEETTALEIYEDLNKEVDYIFSGIGTGGTISGVSKTLKPLLPNLKMIGIEPSASPIITKQEKGPHKIQGIGTGFIPKNLNLDAVDEVVTVDDMDAYKYANILAKSEGLLVGISSGAALSAMVDYVKKHNLKNKKIVVVLPDTGMRYLSDPNYGI